MTAEDLRQNRAIQNAAMAAATPPSKTKRLRIADAAKHAFLEIVVGVEMRQINQGGVLARYERRQTMDRKCSNRGPHESDQRCLNAETIPEAASALRSGAILVAGLNPARRSVSVTSR